MLHIPILRKGTPYRSLEIQRAVHHRTREPFVEISQANPGLIRRDLLDQQSMRRKLAAMTTRELIDITVRAAAHFASDELPLGDATQTPDDYVAQVSATTGMPFALARRNMDKIRGVMAQIETVVNGLTRNLDLRILDEGYGELNDHQVSFFPRGDSLGVVLPNNSPGVHSLWVPAIAFKMPLVLKPGSAEPWTPYRIIQAFAKAGLPTEAFCYYPSDHAGAGELLRRCGRGMIFGDLASTGAWKGDTRIEVHGPGYSKILIGEDCIDDWERYLDVITGSIVENGGRSCINASGVWVPRHGEAIAEALARRFAGIVPRDAEDPAAMLAPFTEPVVAERISQLIDRGFAQPGAREVTLDARGAERLAHHNGCAYLLPTIVQCDSPEHELANREFLFPFASVVTADQADIPEVLGPSLVVTAITSDQNLIRRLLDSPNVDRLNIGAVPTNHVAWDQPHEGNLFEHLYSRRAFQRSLIA